MGREIILMLWLSIPVAVLYFIFLSYRKTTLERLRLQSSFVRETAFLSYCILIVNVVAVKIRPVYWVDPRYGVWGKLHLCTVRPAWNYLVNLKPFGSFFDYYEWIQLGTAQLPYVIQNRLINLMAFAVIGFMTSLLFRRVTLKRVMLLGGLLAVFCELVQYFMVRYSTLDDVLLNTLGMAVGYYLYKSLQSRFPRFIQQFTVHAKVKI